MDLATVICMASDNHTRRHTLDVASAVRGESFVRVDSPTDVWGSVSPSTALFVVLVVLLLGQTRAGKKRTAAKPGRVRGTCRPCGGHRSQRRLAARANNKRNARMLFQLAVGLCLVCCGGGGWRNGVFVGATPKGLLTDGEFMQATCKLLHSRTPPPTSDPRTPTPPPPHLTG